jgi:hypothetical protein
VHLHVGQEVHFDGAHAGAFANFATTAFYVEGKTARSVAPDFGFRRVGKQFSDVAEYVGVGGRVAARRAPDGALVDLDDFVQNAPGLR